MINEKLAQILLILPILHSMPGSFSSTLDTNKYKFLTKIPLDDLEIVKCKIKFSLHNFLMAQLLLSS